ncbi:MAG: hypothetical protein ACE5O2_08155, partial [Armatimonadota bacterium]
MSRSVWFALVLLVWLGARAAEAHGCGWYGGYGGYYGGYPYALVRPGIYWFDSPHYYPGSPRHRAGGIGFRYGYPRHLFRVGPFLPSYYAAPPLPYPWPAYDYGWSWYYDDPPPATHHYRRSRRDSGADYRHSDG